MMKSQMTGMKRAGAIALLAGTTLAANAAFGQATLVNISGATLQQNFFNSTQQFNDFIDSDGNGAAIYLGSPSVQNLAPSPNPTSGSNWWYVTYQATGSVNGYQQLINIGRTFATTRDNDQLRSASSTNTRANASQIVLNGLPVAGSALFNGGNPGGFPVRSQAVGLTPYRIASYIAGPYVGTPEAFTDINLNGKYDQGEPFTDANANGGYDVGRENFTDTNANGRYDAGESFVDGSNGGLLNGVFDSAGVFSPGGVQIDIAPLDVPSRWATTLTGPAQFELKPGKPGYGDSPRTAVLKTGGITAAGNKLATLTGGANLFTIVEAYTDSNASGFYEVGEAYVDTNNNGRRDPNSDTLYDTQTAFAPVAVLTSMGTGVQEVTISQLRHLFTTGRLPTGENLVAVTRDSGSGTRNAFTNSLGIDPSWGVGENIGPISNPSNEHLAGPSFIPGNKEGSGGLESTVLNHRLAIGYTGAERALSNMQNCRWEVLGVKNDANGYSQPTFNRPSLDNVLDNNPNTNGYMIGGPGTLVTFGSPLANAAAKGGLGWAGAFDPFTDTNNNGVYELGEPFVDLNGNGVRNASNAETRPASLGDIPMRNAEAAAYMNNLTRSITAFTQLNPIAAERSPGELLLTQLVVTAGTDFAQDPTDPSNWVPNPAFSQRVQDQIRTLPSPPTIANSRYNAFDASCTGVVPTRQQNVAYLDGVSGTQNFYTTQTAGVNLNYAAAMTLRNKIGGDFNNDGVRNAGDIAEMMAAFKDRFIDTGSITWQPGTAASIEVLGDFNGDGNMTVADVRYFGDGLAVVGSGRVLDRKQGFIVIDNAWQSLTGSLFFAGTGYNGVGGDARTTLANPNAAYSAGDARADVIGVSGNVTPGWAPVGADGNIDCRDITYIYRQFKSNPSVLDGAANWNDVSGDVNGRVREALTTDLSCDLNGDLIVDDADIAEILSILETSMGDVNLDGVVDATDCTIITTNLGLASASWCDGDVDGDGTVTEGDLAYTISVTCDYNSDGGGDTSDVIDLANDIASGSTINSCISKDFNGDGGADTSDVIDMADAIASGTCP